MVQKKRNIDWKQLILSLILLWFIFALTGEAYEYMVIGLNIDRPLKGQGLASENWFAYPLMWIIRLFYVGCFIKGNFFYEE